MIKKRAKVKILEINVEKERISLGIKQLTNDPIQNFVEQNPIKSKVTGKIVELDEKFLKIELKDQERKRSSLNKTDHSWVC